MVKELRFKTVEKVGRWFRSIQESKAKVIKSELRCVPVLDKCPIEWETATTGSAHQLEVTLSG